MAVRSVTFRDQTNGKLTDLLEDETFPCAHTQALLAYFVGALVGYKEEGVELSPTILVTTDLQALVRAIPGTVHYRIGRGVLGSGIGKKILKECGVLSSESWVMYVERSGSTGGYSLDGVPNANFGVLSYPRTPSSISLDEAIQIDDGLPVLVIRRIAQNEVEVIGSKKNRLSIVFSTMREGALDDSRTYLGSFVGNCVCQAEVDRKEDFTKYLVSLLERVLSKAHGTIMICVGREDEALAKQLQDSIILNPPLDFAKAYREYREGESAFAYLRLQASEELLLGFLQSDGIVVFNEAGSVTAYRAFFRGDKDSGAGSAKVVGGARRRAFEGISMLVGASIKASLFRSQDGLTLYKGAKHD